MSKQTKRSARSVPQWVICLTTASAAIPLAAQDAPLNPGLGTAPGAVATPSPSGLPSTPFETGRSFSPGRGLFSPTPGFGSTTALGSGTGLGASGAFDSSGAGDPGLPSGVLVGRPGLHWGRFLFHGGLAGSVAYDDFVTLNEEGTGESDLLWTASPYIIGRTEGPNNRSIALSYRPSFLFYTDHSDLNNVNHLGDLMVEWPFNRLTLSLLQNAALQSVVVRDIGDRGIQQNYSTQGTATYELSHRTSLQGSISYSRADVTGGDFVGYQSLSEQAFVDYRYSQWTTVGAGVSVNESFVENAPTQISEGPMVRTTYTPSANLSIEASAGAQVQHFQTDVSTRITPTFRLSGIYTPRPGTSLLLQGTRTEQPSALTSGQNFSQTSATASLSQTFYRKFAGSLAASYSWADYYATEPGIVVQRTDNYYSVRGSLSYTLRENISTSLFVEHSANDSSGTAMTFDHNVVGLQAVWSF